MTHFSIPVEVRWSDLDPHFHLRHSVYFDYGAYARISYLHDIGLTPQVFEKKQFGPIIFREEALYKKEIHFGDKLMITACLLKAKPDFSRWTIVHEIYKNGDTLSAVITLDGAWLNTATRKLFEPDAFLIDAFGKSPKHENFAWIPA